MSIVSLVLLFHGCRCCLRCLAEWVCSFRCEEHGAATGISGASLALGVALTVGDINATGILAVMSATGVSGVTFH